ncbi:OPT oligopeptide transporter protein-domain-containing protein [Entophlyctis helioformis]|nr:OPT oligopeptide transporter protein-domain-containing protein [Entophlyctis helioformis]
MLRVPMLSPVGESDLEYQPVDVQLDSLDKDTPPDSDDDDNGNEGNDDDEYGLVEDGTGRSGRGGRGRRQRRSRDGRHGAAPDADLLTSSIVPTTDDPNAPSLTLRALALGTAWCVFLGAVNAILAFRTTPFSIPSFLATLLSYPMGIFLATVVPRREISICGYKWPTNPGRFGIKEHVLVTVIASAGASVGYGIDNVVTQKSAMFMGNTDITFLESLLWVLTTQFVGFGMAGLARRYLVKPRSMIWPGILSTVALFVGFHAEHSNDTRSQYKLSRFNFFWIAFVAAFLYTWIPQYFMVALQSFSPLCLLFAGSRWIKFLASTENRYGVGIGGLTLDWYYIGGGQLTTPWWATINMLASNVIFAWVITPLVFYANAFGADQKLHVYKYPDGTPIPVLNSADLFNASGNRISAVKLYQLPSFDLNETVYKAQAPIYITSFFALVYATSFLSIVAAFVHVFLWHGTEIWEQARAAFASVDDSLADMASDLEQNLGLGGRSAAAAAAAAARKAGATGDIHNQLMASYPHVPERFFALLLAALVGLQIIISQTTPFEMPVWAVFLCLFMAALSVLPIGIITAVSGQRLGLNVLTEFVIGLLIPGKTVAVMAFKSLGTNSVIQAITLLSDLKLGHYLHINPVHMVLAQLYGSLVGAIVNTATTFWVLDHMGSVVGTGDWQATNYFIFFNAGAIWGAIGPARFFGIGSPYAATLWFFALGLLLPVVPWALDKYWLPSPMWRLVHVPLLASFNGPGQFQNYFVVPFAVAWFFQRFLFERYHGWWAKYNYVLAVALDSGVGICVLLITLIGQWGIEAPVWSLNPDIGRGVPIDYYCMERDYKVS